MKKKILEILICGILILGIAGCKDETTNESNNNSNNVNETTNNSKKEETKITNSIKCSDDVSGTNLEAINAEYKFNNDKLVEISISYVYKSSEENVESRAENVCTSFKENGGKYTTTNASKNICTVIFDTSKMSAQDFKNQELVDDFLADEDEQKPLNEFDYESLYQLLSSQNGKTCSK